MLLDNIYYGKTPIVRAYKSKDIIWSIGTEHTVQTTNNFNIFNGMAMVTNAAMAQIQIEYSIKSNNLITCNAIDSTNLYSILIWSTSGTNTMMLSVDSKAITSIQNIDSIQIGDIIASPTNVIDISEILETAQPLQEQSSASLPLDMNFLLDSNQTTDLLSQKTTVNIADEDIELQFIQNTNVSNSDVINAEDTILTDSISFTRVSDSNISNINNNNILQGQANTVVRNSLSQTAIEEANVYEKVLGYSGVSQTIYNNIETPIKEEVSAQSKFSQPTQVQDLTNCVLEVEAQAPNVINGNIQNQVSVQEDAVEYSRQSITASAKAITQYQLELLLTDSNTVNQETINNNINTVAKNELKNKDTASQSINKNISLEHKILEQTSNTIPSQLYNIIEQQSDITIISSNDKEFIQNNDTILFTPDNSDMQSTTPKSNMAQTSIEVLPAFIPQSKNTVQNIAHDAAVFNSESNILPSKIYPTEINSINTFEEQSNLQATDDILQYLIKSIDFNGQALMVLPLPYICETDVQQLWEVKSQQTIGNPTITNIFNILRSGGCEQLISKEVNNGIAKSLIQSQNLVKIDQRAVSYSKAQTIAWSEVQAFLKQLSSQELGLVSNIFSQGDTILIVNKTWDGFITDLYLRNNNNITVISSNLINTLIDLVMQNHTVAYVSKKKLVNIENLVTHIYAMTSKISKYRDENIVITNWETINGMANMVQAVCSNIANDSSPIETNCSFRSIANLSVINASDWEWPIKRDTDLFVTQVYYITSDNDTNIMLF